jgi:hypothetical protein
MHGLLSLHCADSCSIPLYERTGLTGELEQGLEWDRPSQTTRGRRGAGPWRKGQPWAARGPVLPQKAVCR